jgi:hypothetical protein
MTILKTSKLFALSVIKIDPAVNHFYVNIAKLIQFQNIYPVAHRQFHTIVLNRKFDNYALLH